MEKHNCGFGLITSAEFIRMTQTETKLSTLRKLHVCTHSQSVTFIVMEKISSA